MNNYTSVRQKLKSQDHFTKEAEEAPGQASGLFSAFAPTPPIDDKNVSLSTTSLYTMNKLYTNTNSTLRGSSFTFASLQNARRLLTAFALALFFSAPAYSQSNTMTGAVTQEKDHLKLYEYFVVPESVIGAKDDYIKFETNGSVGDYIEFSAILNGRPINSRLPIGEDGYARLHSPENGRHEKVKILHEGQTLFSQKELMVLSRSDRFSKDSKPTPIGEKSALIDGGTPPSGFTANCGDNRIVDAYVSDVDCSGSPHALTAFPNSHEIYQVVVEVVYKGVNPGESTAVEASDGNQYLVSKANVVNQGNSGFHIYRGLIPSNVSWVSHTAASNSCTNNSETNDGLQSLASFAFRNVTIDRAGSGVFTVLTGYNSIAEIDVTIPTSDLTRDVIMKVPFSEITLDGRYVTLNAKVDGAVLGSQTWTFGPAGGACCIDLLEFTVPNVPGGASVITVEVDTRNGLGPGGVDGQSYTIAGLAYADVECPMVEGDCVLEFRAEGDCGGEQLQLRLDGNTVATYTLTDTYQVYTYNNFTSNSNVAFWFVNDGDVNGCNKNLYLDYVKVGDDTYQTANSATTSNPACNFLANERLACNGGFDFGQLSCCSLLDPGAITTNHYIECVEEGDTADPPTFIATDGVCSNGSTPAYQWQEKTVGTNVFTDIPGATGKNYNPTARPISSRWYRRGATCACNNETLYTNVRDVHIRPAPSVVITTTDVSCDGSTGGSITFTFPAEATGTYTTIQLSIDNGNTIVERPGNSGSYTFSSLGTGTYLPFAQWKNAGCGKTIPPVQINQEPNLTVTASNDLSICVGGSVPLSASITGGSGMITYAWNQGAGTGANVVVSPAATTTYTVTATDANGCADTDQVRVTVVPDPIITINSDGSTVCEGGAISFTSTINNVLGCTDIRWQIRAGTSGSFGSYIATASTYSTATNLAPGTYQVRARYLCSGEGCDDDDSNIVTITIEEDPEVSIVLSDNTLCLGETATITATPSGGIGCNAVRYQFRAGTSGSWTVVPGVTGNTLSTDGTLTPGTYQYRAQLICGGENCNTDNSNVVTIVVKPDPSGTIEAQSICLGETATLTVVPTVGDAPFTFAWSDNGGTNASTNFAPSATTVYAVTITDDNDCDVVIQGTVNVREQPTVAISGPAEICANELTTYSVTPVIPGATYSWDFGSATTASPNTATGSSASVTYSEQGSYLISLTVTSENNCSASTSTTVIVREPITADAGDDLTVCQGGGILIDGSNSVGSSFNWTIVSGDPTSIDGSSNSQTLSASPLFETVYRLTVRDATGICFRSDDMVVQVDVNLNPTADAAVAEALYCSGATVTLDGGGSQSPVDDPTAPLNYLWFEGEPIGANFVGIGETVAITPQGSSTYTLIVSVDGGGTTCSDTATVMVNVVDCASLGDYVWEDTNGNGINDEPASAGVDGVTVNLKNEAGNVIETTTTMNGGFYEFTDLTPGTYSVQFVLPNGYTYTTLGAIGSDETNDSDADPAMNGMTDPVVLESGDNNEDLDAGIQRVPSMEIEKTFVSAVIQANGSYNVTYVVDVINTGGIGTYSVTDTPSFDDDVTINSGTYSGADAGALNVLGATVLTTNNMIAADATETFTLIYNVTLDTRPTSTDGGDNTYTECGTGGPNGNGTPGEGLYNLAELDVNSDGSVDDSDGACGDLPDIKLEKTFIDAVVQADGSYNVRYSVDVTNFGGAAGDYDLYDTPTFENDVTIVSGSYTGDSGNEGGPLATSGQTQLADDNTIAPGASEQYLLTYNVTLDLTGSVNDGGDDVYTACDGGNLGGLDGTPGTGLYNRADLDTNNDGQTDDSDDACGDLPNIVLDKEFVSATPNANGTYTVVYTIDVTNNGGAEGTYGLVDTPTFDNDVVINSGSFAGEVGGALNTTGATTLTTNNTITAGATETFTLTYIVTLDIEPGSTDGGDNMYTECDGGSEEGITGTPGTGLYNRADLDTNNDGQPDVSDDDCGDLPLFDLALDKEVVSVGPYEQGSTVSYTVAVTNEGDIDAANVEVTDTPENDLVFSSVTPQAGITSNGNGSFTVAALPVGATVTVTLNYTISNTFQGTSLNNAAEITEDGPFDDIDSDPETGPDTDEDGDGDGDDDDEDNVDININQTYDLALTKDLASANTNPIVQGAELTYTITVTNEGSLDAANVEVTDTPGAGLSYVGENLPAGVTGTNGVYVIADLDQGETVSFEVTYAIGATFQGSSVTNDAEITEDDGDDEDSDPETGDDVDEDGDGDGDDDDEDEVTTPIEQTFDLAIDKALALGQAPFTLSGATVRYQITITNEGSLDATNVEVMDDEPTGLNYLSADVAGTNVIENGGGSFTVPALAQGESVTFEISYMTDASAAIGEILTNQIEITDDADGDGDDVTDIDSSPETGFDEDDLMDGVEDDDEDDVSITNIGINVEKVADKTTICAGEEVTYTLTVRFRDNVCGPGLELREISVEDMGSDGFMRMLIPNDAFFVGASDPNGDGVLQCGEEFMWTYTLTHTETYTNTAMEMAEVWFIDPVQGDLFVGNAMFEDDVTVTVDPNQCAKIGDFVWNDLNADGNQDMGEPGIQGVMVNLYASDDLVTVLDMETTGSNGEYEFTGLIPGTYVVEFVNPDGSLWLPSPQDDGGTDLTDSDANPVTGFSHEITVVNGTDDPSIDASFYQLAEVGDFVWIDTDGDGIQDMDGTEPGLPGVAVTLFDENGTQINQVMTGPNGEYLFTGLEPGNYAITVGEVPGYNFSPANQGGNDATDTDFPDGTTMVPVNLESGESDITYDAGFTPVCDLQVTPETTQVDCNGNNTGAIELTVSGGLEPYSFAWSTGATTEDLMGLTAGAYTVTVTAENTCTSIMTYTVTEPEALVIDETIIEISCNEVTGASIDITVSGGTTDYGYLWTGPGVVETNEDQTNLGAGTYTVEVADANNCMATETYVIAPAAALEANIEDDAICPNTDQLGSLTVLLTVGNGNYTYLWDAATGDQTGPTATDLAAGTYTVTITDNESNCSIEVTGTVIEDADACASLGDYVWFDENENGVQDDDEDGVFNVTVNLKDANGVVVATTTTSLEGFYIFENLAPGTYSVQFELPARFLWTTLGAVAGANEDLDSDADPAMDGMTEQVTLVEGEDYSNLDAGIVLTCEIFAEVTIEPECNDNGTPTAPGDDFYTVTILVTGDGSSGQWVSSRLDRFGNPISGTVGEPFVFQLPVVQDRTDIVDVSIIFSDAQDPKCEAIVSFTPTGSCSDQCLITAVNSSAPICDDNGTPSDPADDVFYLGITAEGLNQAGSGWTATVGGRAVGTGGYGVENLEVGPFNSADMDANGMVVVTITDNEDPGCTATVSVSVPADALSCSDACFITVEFNGPGYCSDNGTQNDTSDDVWYADVFVSGRNFDRWTSPNIPGGTPLRPGRYTFGPFDNPQDATTIDITVIAWGTEEECSATTQIFSPVTTCSNDCDIEGEILDIYCDDNGTPTDPSDDVFYVVATANTVGTNNGNEGWILRDGNSRTAPIIGVGPIFGNTYTFGPFPLHNEDGTLRTTAYFRIEDATSFYCRVNFPDTELPDTCSPDVVECDLDVTIFDTECDNNGTETDGTDDIYSFTILATGSIGDYTVVYSSPAGRADDRGTFGETETFFGIDRLTNVSAVIIPDDANCDERVSLFVQATGECVDCQLEVVELSNVCDDQGTSDPSDDTFVVTLEVNHAGDGTAYMVDVPGQGIVIGTYATDTIVTFEFPIAGNENLMLTFADLTFQNACDYTIMVDAPATCSPCELIASDVVETPCDDNGTPEDGSDDFFTATFTVSGANAGANGWVSQSNGMSISGSYDEPFVLTLPTGTGNLTFEIVDADNADCGTTIEVEVPENCEVTPECELTAVVTIDPVCNDEGGYTFTVMVTNSGDASDNGWVADNGQSGQYGVPTTITVADACDDIRIVFRDADHANDDTCLDVIEETAPAITITAPDDTDMVDDDGTIRDLICDDYAGIFGDAGTLTGTPTITGCGIESTDITDTYISGGPDADPTSCEATVIQRVFTATACNGLMVADTQLITIRKPLVTDVIFPAGPVDFDCEGEGFPTDANGNPATSVTGIPAIVTVFGDTIRFDDVFCGTLSVSYSDEEEATCSGTMTITRTWTAVDACSDDVLTAEQIIRTGDFSAPVVTCPTSNHYCPVLENDIMLFPMDLFDCVSNLTVPTPEVTDACSDSWTIVTYVVDNTGDGDTLFVLNEGDSREITLPAGDYVFRYRVTDDCGNVGTTDCIFRVADTQEPAAICISDINVSVGGYGIARVYSQMINLGSYDNCGLDSILVRRQILIDEVTGDTLDTPTWSAWGPYAEVNCNDAGSVVLVQLRVVDFGGNENICTTNVAVVDNTLPYCTGLEDIFLTCTNVPAGIDLTDTVDLQNTFGIPVVIDNCAADAIELSPIVDLDECFGAGTVIRRWLAVDGVGNVSAQEFTQVITVTADLGFTLVIPKDTITDCLDAAQGFDVLGLSCADISVTFKDTLVETLASDGDACMVIERHYTVINNCMFDPATDTLMVISRDEDCDGLEGESVFYGIVTGDSTYVDVDTTFNNAIPAAGTRGTECTGETNRAGHLRSFANTGGWSYTQRIVIFDETRPVLNFDVPDTFCATEESGCETIVEIPISISDECTAAGANWLVLIDLGRDGNSNLRLPAELAVQGTFPNYFIKASIPIGEHNLMVRYTDGCNNSVAVAIPFEIVDCSIPDPICYSGLIANLDVLETPVVGTDGELIESGVVVDAGRLASCNVEDCSGPLRFSVNRIGEVPHVDSTSVLLTCDDRYTVELEVYMWDSAFNPFAVQPDGTIGGPNWKVCTVEVLVQDPDLVCDDCNADGSLTLGGGVTTSRGITLPGVEMELAGITSGMVLSGDDGKYFFEGVDAGSYMITPYKEDDAANGISTLDELILQRHLLGIELITDPLIFMAADLNNSGTLTIIDRLLMRNIILGNTEVLPEGETWRFVPVSYFDGSNDIELSRTMNAPRSIRLSDLESCLSGNDFYAIKKGDLNSSVFISTLNGTILNGTRGRSTNDTHPLEIEEHHLQGGDLFDLPVRVGDLEALAGMQFTLDFATDAVVIEEVVPGLMEETQLGLTQMSRGYVSATWTQKEELRAGDAVLFTVRLRSLRPVAISDAVSFGDTPTYSEAYRVGTEELVDLALNITPAVTDAPVYDSGPGYGLESGIVLSQNYPNPFGEETTISFTLPEAGEATINVYDLTGRVVKELKGEYTAGEHAVKLQGKNLPVETLIYTLSFNGQRLTRTMLRVRQ